METINSTHIQHVEDIQYDVYDDKQKQDMLLIVMDSLVNALVLLLNISLILLIITNAGLRKQLFYLRVVNLCISDLIVGVIVLPFGISYMHNHAWLHGHSLCRAYVIIDITHFGFSALVITSICLDRVLTKILELRPDYSRLIKYSQIVLFILPWFFTICVFLPVLLSGVRVMGVVYSNTCGFVVHDDMLIPTTIVAYFIPNVILISTAVFMLILYKIKGPVWYRLPNDEASESVDGTTTTSHMRSSMIASLIVSSVTVLFWLPYLIIIFIMATCRSLSCYPGLEVFKITLLLSTLSSLFTPCLWVTDDQLRAVVKMTVDKIRLFCRPRIVREQQYVEQLNEDDL